MSKRVVDVFEPVQVKHEQSPGHAATLWHHKGLREAFEQTHPVWQIREGIVARLELEHCLSLLALSNVAPGHDKSRNQRVV